MTVVFRQFTYNVPGAYLWVKPSITPGAGPFGSTYQKTIMTVIGPGSGGSSGSPHVGDAAGAVGGSGGNAGAYANVTYLPASLNATLNILVSPGTPGGVTPALDATFVHSGATVRSATGLASSVSSFAGGQLVSCNGGFSSLNQQGGVPTVNGGTNITVFQGCANSGDATINNVVSPASAPSTGPNIFNTGSFPSWRATPPNNAGAPGGPCNTAAFATAHNIGKGSNGGGVNFVGGGNGINDSTGTAGSGTLPGAGGGASCSALAASPVNGGNGAPAAPNTGAGGGGGGSAAMFTIAASGFVTAGAGGKGGDGVVQITDIFLMPTPPPVDYFNWDLVTWFHMINMARPISLTGRYKS